MKLFLFSCFSLLVNVALAQSLSKMPDSVRKQVDEYTGVARTASNVTIDDERRLKEKLVQLAIKRSNEVKMAEAQVEVAEIARKKAKSTLLSSVSLGANANEFVINNSAAANFFPKYNIGLAIPLDLFAKAKAEKKTADQLIAVNTANKNLAEQNIRTRVLMLYETYKEKKEILELQKIAMENDISAYQKGQQDYAANLITLDELNKIYKGSVNERSILATKQKEYNISVIELEQAIGVSLDKVL